MNSSIPVVSIIVATATLYILFVAIGFAGVKTNIKAQGLEKKLNN